MEGRSRRVVASGEDYGFLCLSMKAAARSQALLCFEVETIV
jgi:hypothetical protein